MAQIEEFLGLEQNLMVMVMGARRTGKTTAVKQVLDIVETRNWGMLFHSFDTVFEAQPLPEPSRSKPERLAQGDLGSVWQQARQQARRQGHPVVLVLDEIQGVPEWQHLAKQLWDQDRYLGSSLKVVITGSAPLLLAAGAAAELQGRYLPVECPHWSFAEMAEVFSRSLDEYLFFGGYPFAGGEDAWRKFVSGIIDSFLLEDLLAVAPDIRKREGLLRLLPAALHHAGRQVSYSKLGRLVPAVSNTTTLARYLDYFGHMRLVTGLPGYRAALPDRRTSPKIVALNNALVTAGSSYSFAAARADRIFWGRLVENAVGAHLVQTLAGQGRLSYWRAGDAEVDYVVSQDRRLIAIEVKSVPTGKQPLGLKEFKKKHRRALIRKIPGPDMSLERFFSQPASRTIEQWLNEDS